MQFDFHLKKCVYAQKFQLPKKFVVVKDNIESWQDEKGIQYVGVEQFLLEEDFLK